jgi:hypothetical protein
LHIENIIMGKGLKKEWLQELEKINQIIQAENAELKRLMQVAEEEKQELQDSLQTKDDLLAKIQNGEKVEDKEESTMQRRLSSTIDVQTQTEVCRESVSSCSLSSQYANNVGMKLLKKMGYRGVGLGTNGQGVTHPLEVVPRTPFEGLGYGKEENGECSKVVEEKSISSPSDSKKGIKSPIPQQNKKKNPLGKYT